MAGPPMEVGSTYRYVDGTLLVAVPGGPFIMGHGGTDNPEHEVTLGDFWIYQTEVTNRQFEVCVAMGQCTPPSRTDNATYGVPLKANDPVSGVTHDQAVAYCTWVHGRLPTEAEWEKTARGPEGNIYPWGDASPSCKLENTAECVGERTHVLEYPDGKSYYDAMQMAGNVFEWVADWYSPSYYGDGPALDPLGPELGSKRSVRSSGFDSPFFESESARRFSAKPTDHRPDLGFRCVVEDPLYFAPFCEAKLVYGMDANGNPIPGSGSQKPCEAIVDFGQYCEGPGNPKTTVTFPAGLADMDVPPSCSGGPLVYTCTPPGGPVYAKLDCDVPLTSGDQCPPGFTRDGQTCKAAGRPGQCLAGSTYDPDSQCCSALTGDGVAFDLCPVGWYDTPGGCVEFPAQGSDDFSQNIPFFACPGDDDDTPCDPASDPNCVPPDDNGCTPGEVIPCGPASNQNVCYCPSN
jgi:formylglycine-generating enzyme required for sulfatase activity